MPSIADLERLLAKAPGDADLLYGLAMEHAKAGRVDVACGLYDRCLEADAGYCYAYYHMARALEGAGRMEEARAVLRAGLEAAKRAGDGHAESEIEGYLAELE
jgi:tetratricopeptide (TPR) repeat protein